MDHDDLMTTFRTLRAMMTTDRNAGEFRALHEARSIVAVELATQQWPDDEFPRSMYRKPGESLEDMERRLLAQGGI